MYNIFHKKKKLFSHFYFQNATINIIKNFSHYWFSYISLSNHYNIHKYHQKSLYALFDSVYFDILQFFHIYGNIF